MINIFYLRYLILLLPIILLGNISGKVYQDLPVRNTLNGLETNQYAINESNELGIQGIQVKAFPEEIATITDENGVWDLNTTKNSRIEFSNIPSYLNTSPGSFSIQFVENDSTNTNLALHNPKDYSTLANLSFINNLQENGTHLTSDLQTLQTINYAETGLNRDYQEYNTTINGTGTNAPDTIRTKDIGSVWGKAYQKNKKRLFITSMLQRHVGFANSPADIYVIDYSLGNPATLLGSFSIEGKIPSNGGSTISLGTVQRIGEHQYVLQDNPLQSNIDFDAYAKVGKVSYGGTDIDYHSNTLWLINLHQQGLISIDISGNFSSLATTDIKQFSISNLNNAPTCQNGQLRPWALKVHEGRGYIGTICDASTSKSINDLTANIISFDIASPQNGFINEIHFDLNYTREGSNWHAWEDTFVELNKTQNGTIYSQPILGDIEFDRHNNMYITFIDRYATQLGSYSPKAKLNVAYNDLEKAYSYGEILKICNNNGIYEKEGTADCTQVNYLASNEFFNDKGGAAAINKESSLGSLALLKGSDQLLSTMVDPHPENDFNNLKYANTQGVHTLSTINGGITNWYSHAMTDGKGLNTKANGIGDIELISEPAPLEIGNRIWKDSNGNGIQDANETGIPGVSINLVCNNTTVANASSDAHGHYIFSNDPNKSSTTSYIYNITTLIESQNSCLIKIPNAIGLSQQTVLANLQLTTSNIGEGSNSIQNDSNGLISGDEINININALDIPIAGANNHSFDIGFKPQAIVLEATTSSSANHSCPEYTSKSIPTLNVLHILLIILTTLSIFYITIKDK